MNGENFGGGYNGYGFNADGTEKERDDLGPEDFGQNVNQIYASSDPFRRDELEKAEETSYEEGATFQDKLDNLCAKFDKLSYEEKVHNYVNMGKTAMTGLEKMITTQGAESAAAIKQPEGEKVSVTTPTGVEESKDDWVAGPDGLLTSRKMFLGEDRE